MPKTKYWDGTKWVVVEPTAAEILAKLITVDGSGSGLDADKVDGIEFRINSGSLEYNDGTGWKSVGNQVDVTALSPFFAEVTGVSGGTGAFKTIFSVNGTGFLDSFYGNISGTTGLFQLRVTVDGVVKVLLGVPSGTKHIGVVNKKDIRQHATAGQHGVPAIGSVTFGVSGANVQPTAFKIYPTTDGSDGWIVLGDEKIWFKQSLLLEALWPSTANLSYHYNGGYQ